jgi:ribosomal protein S18 acetylase RimI-like enzyme
MQVGLVAATADDAQALVALRIAAMRESLERIGRFDPTRARDRFLEGFSVPHTRHVVLDGERIGFVVVKPQADMLLLDHLYIRPGAQGRRVGAAVLLQVFAEADAQELPLRVAALRESDANRFYVRHGFRLLAQSEFDNHYLRAPMLPIRSYRHTDEAAVIALWQAASSVCR